MQSFQSTVMGSLGKKMAPKRLLAMKRCGRVMACAINRQIIEIKVRAAIFNRFSQIGTPNTIHVE